GPWRPGHGTAGPTSAWATRRSPDSRRCVRGPGCKAWGSSCRNASGRACCATPSATSGRRRGSWWGAVRRTCCCGPSTRPGRSGSGSSLRRSIPLDPRLREPAARLLSAMAWHGPVMVEFRDDGAGEPCLIEVNGRFWGSLELAIASGVDFPKLWVELLRGERVAATTAYESGVTVRWAWGDVKRLLYVVAGAPPGCPEPYPSVLQG